MAVCPPVEIWSSFQQHLGLTVGAQLRPILEPDPRHRLGGSKRNYGDANRRRPTKRGQPTCGRLSIRDSPELRTTGRPNPRRPGRSGGAHHRARRDQQATVARASTHRVLESPLLRI